MSSRKNSPQRRVVAAGLGALVVLATGTAAASIPMPDHVGRVPLVGLLPRWTWDLSARPAPSTAPAADDGAVAAARQFVVTLLTRQGESARDVVAYRLDDQHLVAVVAQVERRDREETAGAASVAFTVRVTPTSGGGYEAALVLEDR